MGDLTLKPLLPRAPLNHIENVPVVAPTQYETIYRRFADYTMITPEVYAANLKLVEPFKNQPGAVVECGTWRGGMIAGIAYLLGPGRDYFLFDSFEGLPPAKEIDGPAAAQWQADTTSPFYYDNCRASEVDARAAMALAGIHSAKIVKGWFSETLRQHTFPSQSIAVCAWTPTGTIQRWTFLIISTPLLGRVG